MVRTRSIAFAGLFLSALMLLSAWSRPAWGQPVITTDDFMGIGDTAVRVRYDGPIDVAALTTAGPTGNWGFTGVSGALLFTDELACLPTSAGIVDAAVEFPGAEQTIRVTSSAPGVPPFPYGWDYYSYASEGRTFYGSAIDGAPPVVLVVDPPTLDVRLPLQLAQEWSQDYESGIFGFINSLHVDSTADAWGTATLPGIGTVDCVRVTSEVTNTFIDATGPTPVTIGTDYSRVYAWYAQGIGTVALVQSPSNSVAIPAPGFASAQYAEIWTDFVPASGGRSFVRGDVDADGHCELVDAFAILAQLVDGGTLTCLAAADVDDNGEVDIGDAIGLLQFLFTGGPAPAAPYAACGADPTPDLPCPDSGCP